MARLPIPGKDDGTWGDLLNDFLKVEHNSDGSLKPSASLAAKADASSVVQLTGNQTLGGTKTFSDSPVVPDPAIGSHAASKAYVDATSTAGAPDADGLTKGIVQLTGDLTGTATNPQIAAGVIVNADVSASAAIAQSKIANLVTDLVAKQNANPDLTTIAGLAPLNNDILQRKAGAWTNRTPAQFKVDMSLVKADVGLANVDNTSDVNKPISSATQTALNAKADTSVLTAHAVDSTNIHGIADTSDLLVSADIAGKANNSVTITGANSLSGGGNLSANRTLSLVNDASSPGNSKYYGTNGSGTKGFFDVPGGGESNTASNVGVGGVGVFRQKAGVNLEFKNIAAGSNKVTVTNDSANNEIDINVNEANFSGIPQSAVTGLSADIGAKQNSDPDLSTIAALTPSNDDFLQRKSGAWSNRTPGQVKTDLSLTRADVGLASVDNTSDANKPISTATQTALNAKADDSVTINGATSLAGGGSLSANRTISLVNDEALPGNDQYYGTDGAGVKGYHTLPASASGETNTASNIGASGVGIFKQKTGVNLEFKRINAGSDKITITNDGPNDEIDVDINEANFENIPQGAVVGLGADLAAKASVSTLTDHTGDTTNVHGIPDTSNLVLNSQLVDLIDRNETDTSTFGFVIDEDNFTSNSNTRVPTQQSVKAYVDANGGAAASTLDGLTDVTILSPTTGQVLKYDGIGWSNGIDNASSGGSGADLIGDASSVRDQGALGNGVANDTAAVQAAISAAGANGTVIFPSGTYMVNTLTALNGQKWVGTGNAVIKLHSASAYMNLFNRSNMTFSNLTFDGNNFIGTTNGYIVGVGTTTNMRFERCHFKDAHGSAIHGNDTIRLQVMNCSFSDIGAWNGGGPVADNHAEGAAVYATSATDITIQNNLIRRTLCDGAIFVTNATGAYIANNTILDTFYGGINMFASPGATTMTGVHIVGNHLERIGSINNTFNGVGANGISLRGAVVAEQMVAENNFIKDVCENGIEASTRPAIIRNNTIISTGAYATAATSSTEGIWAFNGSIIEGNSINDSDLEGIYYFSTGTISNTIIRDNNITNAGRQTKNNEGADRSAAITLHSEEAAGSSIRNVWISGTRIINAASQMSYSIRLRATGAGGSVAQSSRVEDTIERGTAMISDIGGATTNPLLSTGTGSPEGAVTAPIGSLYTRIDGGADTTLYIKESGSGDTGWIAK